MTVNDDTKMAFYKNVQEKTLRISFPGINLTIGNADIYSESLSLSEKIFDKDSIEFVGCYASLMEVQVHGLANDIKGQRIEVYLTIGGIEEIPLFKGIVDGAKLQSNKYYKKITAYDDLYEKGETDVSAWYNALAFPLPLKVLRDSLFAHIGITQEAAGLPNDGVMIAKQYAPKQLKSINVIKAICQINGAFGIISRNNEFRYLYLKKTQETGAFPSGILFPSAKIYPSEGWNDTGAFPSSARYPSGKIFPSEGWDNSGDERESVSFYKKVDYEEYRVNPVDRLLIRQNEEAEAAVYGDGGNTYIIQGNLFTQGKSAEELWQIAGRIYPHISEIEYHPFESEGPGLPWMECGDIVSFETESGTMEFYILNRRLKGVQALTDVYSAKGRQHQSEFVTDLNTRIDLLKQDIGETVRNEIRDSTYGRQEVDKKIEAVNEKIEEGRLKVESVAALPENPAPNTIYLIQGEVAVN